MNQKPTSSKSKKSQSKPDQKSIDQHVEKLADQLVTLKDQLLRSQADYQNLVRRQMQEKEKLVSMAALEVVEQILTPLDHLELAAKQLQDAGLDMVVSEFKRGLAEIGLEEINPAGEEFDVETMEVVGTTPDAKEQKVATVQAKGYKLNGRVVRHAKVVVGE